MPALKVLLAATVLHAAALPAGAAQAERVEWQSRAAAGGLAGSDSLTIAFDTVAVPGSASAGGSAPAPDPAAATAAAVPEPESWALMFAGVGVIAFVMRRRSRRG